MTDVDQEATQLRCGGYKHTDYCREVVWDSLGRGWNTTVLTRLCVAVVDERKVDAVGHFRRAVVMLDVHLHLIARVLQNNSA